MGTAPPLTGSADLSRVAGASTSRFDVARMVFDVPGEDPFAVSLGTIQTVAEAGPDPVSKLRIDALQAGDVTVPALMLDGRRNNHALQQGVVLSLKQSDGGAGERPRVAAQLPGLDALNRTAGVDGELAVARFHMGASERDGSFAAIGAAGGQLDVGVVGLKAALGDRGVIATVTEEGSRSRVLTSLEDIDIKLGALLPGVTLPLGLSLDLATRLELPVGDTAGKSIERLVRLVDELDSLDRAVAGLEEANARLRAALRQDPAVAALIDALESAEQAVARAAADVAAAATRVDAAKASEAATAQAQAAAEAVAAAAQADLAEAAADVASAQARVDGIAQEIAALEAESLTADPLRLLQIADRLDELDDELAAAQSDLSSAQTAKTAAAAAAQTAGQQLESKKIAAAAATATRASAEAAMAAAEQALERANGDVSAGRVALAAAQSAAAAEDSLIEALTRAVAEADRTLDLVLQAISDVLAALPPLPLLEQQLDEALRDTTAIGIGGMIIESVVEARPDGGKANVQCEVRDVEVLGYRPHMTTCAELLAVQRDLLDRLWTVYDLIGAVERPAGFDLQGPRGYWKPDAELDAEGFQTSRARMAALLVSVPQIPLRTVVDPLASQLDGMIGLLRGREVTRLALPGIRPGVDTGKLSVMSGGTTLAEQLDTLDGQLDDLSGPLGEVRTPGFEFAAASAETVARFRPAAWDGWEGSTFHPGTSVCDGDAECLAACLAGDCRPPLTSGEIIGSGSDSVGVPGGPKLPMTGWFGGLAGLSLLGIGAGGQRWLRRRAD